jgi:exodeoxyribonuclease V alpha subunit
VIRVARPAGLDALAPFVGAGVLGPTEVEVVTTLARLTGETRPEALLAAGLAVRGPLLGHVCVDLATAADAVVVERFEPDPTVGSGRDLDLAGDLVRDLARDLDWPSVDDWVELLVDSPLVARPDLADAASGASRPLVLDGTLVYLDRYWRYERALADAIVARRGGGDGTPDATTAAALDHLFGPDDPARPDWQRRAAESALTRPLTVIAGGPGTGKTRTVARLLAVLEELAWAEDRSIEVRLAAPTGKAATRMTDAIVGEVDLVDLAPPVRQRLLSAEAVTLHRLLGADGRGSFRHHRDDPLTADVVVVDESSMVSLPLMARLFDAVRPEARLVLVGDPSQLASVEAGAVLGDLVSASAGERPRPASPGTELAPEPARGPAGPDVGLVRLDRVHRFDEASSMARLAELIRAGDADAVVDLLRRADHAVLRWVDQGDPAAATIAAEIVDHARLVVADARAGRDREALARLTDVAVLSATRFGPTGVAGFNRLVERGLVEAGLDVSAPWYGGRPVMVTANDALNQVSNGDIGITVIDERPQVVFPAGDGVRRLDPSRLDRVETWWAMTIHKSQGSEFDHVVVVLPPPPSPILTRELLYTAVTRARVRVTVLASEASVRAAVDRPVGRASGLVERLRRAATDADGGAAVRSRRPIEPAAQPGVGSAPDPPEDPGTDDPQMTLF